MRRAILSVVAVVTASSLVLAAPPATAGTDARDLSGTYKAQGVGAGGANYAATVTLTRAGEAYLIRWQFGNGFFEGVGLLNGETLSVGWSNKDRAGVVVYTVKGDKLEGRWTDASTAGKVFSETLTRQP